MAALQQWALPKLSQLLPLDDDSLKQVVTYADSLPNDQAAAHLVNLLGDSPQSVEFIEAFQAQRSSLAATAMPAQADVGGQVASAPVASHGSDTKTSAPPAPAAPPAFAPPAYPPPTQHATKALRKPHTNQVIEAARVRARDEQQMQNRLQDLQYQYGIYNQEIEPEHETDYYCNCPIHQYKLAKYNRLGVQNMWSEAVMYPGEKSYHDSYLQGQGLFSSNPYKYRVISPYGQWQSSWYGLPKPRPNSHASSIHQTISLNNSLNRKAQADIDAREPKVNIWGENDLNELMASASISATGEKKRSIEQALDRKLSNVKTTNEKVPSEKAPVEQKRPSLAPPSNGDEASSKSSKRSSFRKIMGMKSSEEKAVEKVEKHVAHGQNLRQAIEQEEEGRWPDDQWRYIVAGYQEKVGMTKKIADLRARSPIQYLHLLRAGYFEPIPVAWAGSASNPLKFSIEASGGWRGITPAWRGYEDTAEERLYWVLNHREGSVGTRLKPDFISEMNMARERMAKAVEPPPEYFSNDDTCHLQHTSEGYSKQVMPSPFRAFDRPEQPTDDTMILLDVSGSMDFKPVRPIYNQYLITDYARSTQPKNKDVAKAIIRRFTDAMANHDHQFQGYDMTTFSSQAKYIGTINHQNLEEMWKRVQLGGGTRVMTGWQKVKDLHFQKHSASATHHPIYGWQAGPDTPMLRLLLLLDGEATDMDEFELDLLGLSWAHVTIFLIGVDGCPHHHRHANELQRISDVNHHVSFVDAQGNTPERYVTHELLKRHLGYEISMSEFQEMEQLPPYSE